MVVIYINRNNDGEIYSIYLFNWGEMWGKERKLGKFLYWIFCKNKQKLKKFFFYGNQVVVVCWVGRSVVENLIKSNKIYVMKIHTLGICEHNHYHHRDSLSLLFVCLFENKFWRNVKRKKEKRKRQTYCFTAWYPY